MPRKNPKITINAGAVIVVEIGGIQYRYTCTGVTKGEEKPEKVIKSIQDCVRSSIAKATKTGKTK